MGEQDQARAKAVLDWFVFRARRVAEHSLAADRDRLNNLANGQLILTQVAGGPMRVTRDLPPEEQFESLAGRCRPFLLAQDDVYFGKVVDALRLFLAGDDERVAVLDELTEAWTRLDPKGGETLGYAVGVRQPSGATLGDLTADRRLADAWLYCDFAHGDSNVQQRVGEHDLDSRYRAAVLVFSNVAFLAVATLEFVKSCAEVELVPVDEAAFTDRVFADLAPDMRVQSFMVGPPGSTAEDLWERSTAYLAQAATDNRRLGQDEPSSTVSRIPQTPDRQA